MWEVAADVRVEQTFLLFLLSCSHSLPSHVGVMKTTHSQRFVIAANPDATARKMPVVEAVFQVRLPPGKIQRLQMDSAMISPPDTDCFPISRAQARVLNPAHVDFT